MYKKLLVFIVSAVILFPLFGIADEVSNKITSTTENSDRSEHELKWQLLSSGGSIFSVSENTQVGMTIGQGANGFSTAPGLIVQHGFWQEFPEGYVCGDANGDLQVNIGDAVFLINFIFNNGPTPSPLVAGDVNCDGSVNIGDAVYLVNFIFRGGPAPCSDC